MHTRESVRAVGVNDSGEVLLSRVRPTMTLSDGNALWVTLGGPSMCAQTRAPRGAGADRLHDRAKDMVRG
jgi:hypothetical protein